MRLLAFSDVHGHAQVTEAIIAQETARFDAVIVAGDIGSTRPAADVLAPLRALECPVGYVFGNHDSNLLYDADLGLGCHLHNEPLVVGGYCFTGFSGCESHWGHNPIAAEIRQEEERERGGVELPRFKRRIFRKPSPLPPSPPRRSVMRENIAAMTARWQTLDIAAKRTIVVTHERCFRLHEHMPGLAAHLFGHRHGFQVSRRNGTTFVNASDVASGSWRIFQDGNGRCGSEKVDGEPGSYAVIEFLEQEVRVQRVPLPIEVAPPRKTGRSSAPKKAD